MSYKEVVSAWESCGRPLAVDGANTRIWREGKGEPVLCARKFPAQVIWGAQDPALKMARYAPEICEVLGLDSWHQVRVKHFLRKTLRAKSRG